MLSRLDHAHRDKPDAGDRYQNGDRGDFSWRPSFPQMDGIGSALAFPSALPSFAHFGGVSMFSGTTRRGIWCHRQHGHEAWLLPSHRRTTDVVLVHNRHGLFSKGGSGSAARMNDAVVRWDDGVAGPRSLRTTKIDSGSARNRRSGIEAEQDTSDAASARSAGHHAHRDDVSPQLSSLYGATRLRWQRWPRAQRGQPSSGRESELKSYCGPR
jgi:hypothetical protein